MIKHTQQFLLVLLALFFGPAGFSQERYQLALIPEPGEMATSTGQFVVSRNTTLYYSGLGAKAAAELCNTFFESSYGFRLKLKQTATPHLLRGNILFKAAVSGAPEAYGLSVSAQEIRLTGDAAGLFYGLQTLQQMAPAGIGQAVAIPAVSIKDQPRFGYRGLMLDVSRHFFPVAYIRQFLDVMAQFKFNRFHWHLTDDQGWRMEIKKYPRLQSVGAWRKPLANIKDSPFTKDGKYGGFYTQAEVKELVAYAAERHITVIPEIEMPGHSIAALASYPHLGCTEGPYEVAPYGEIKKDVYCAGKEATFNFLQDVLTELVEIFPAEYIHIGGDETPKDRWKACPKCQQRIKTEGLRDEHELQSYFVQRIEKFLRTKGRKIIGWDEILEGGLAPNATVMSWRGESGGIAAARLQHDVIMSPYTYLYLDYYQGSSRTEPPAFPAQLPLSKVYSYEPLSDSLTTAQHRFIKGIQGNVWAENIRDGDHADYMTYPRALAAAEVAWSPASAKNYTRFLNKLKVRLNALEHQGLNFRIPEPKGFKDSVTIASAVQVVLEPSVAGAEVYYTLDGTMPDAQAKTYKAPFTLQLQEETPVVVKLRTVLKSGRSSGVYAATFIRKAYHAAASVTPKKSGVLFKSTLEKFVSAKDIRIVDADTSGVLPGFDLLPLAHKKTLYLIGEGYLEVPEDNLYKFQITSDDGALLFINDQLLIENDGEHAATAATGIVPLRKGFHKVRLQYFDAGGGRHLELKSGPAHADRLNVTKLYH